MPSVSKKADPMAAPKSGVTVRMYNTGFGDCFLLAFAGRKGKPVYVLIDCGVHSQFTGGGDRVRAVVEHIRQSTGGRLDVVAITHEHADHVSGFSTEKDTFQAMEIGEAWFAWTEDPTDASSRELREERRRLTTALQAAVNRLRGVSAGEVGLAAELAGFHGVDERGQFSLRTQDALKVVRDKARTRRYFRPKCDPVPIPGVDGVRVFVLGPPTDLKYLRRAVPSGKPGQVYLDGQFLVDGGEDAGTSQPFTGEHRIAPEVAANKDFFRAHYGFANSGPDADAWRRIGDDWLSTSETMALKLDAATNNTSLVLAFELPDSRRVLLFPGDAQVGNWESWHEGGWSEKNGLKKGETITARDLLERTVLYKVGHHGSHNATLREKGLEMMTSRELMAMISVDSEWAKKRRPNAWLMPYDKLEGDLKIRTEGRILRTDALGEGFDGKTWGKAKPRIEKGLYAEVTIED